MSLSSYRLVLSKQQAALRVSRSRPSPPAYHHRLHRLLRGLKTACLASLCPFVVKCCCLLLLYRLYILCQYSKVLKTKIILSARRNSPRRLLSLLAPSADTVETVVDERAVAEMGRNATSSPRNRQRGNPVGDLVSVAVGREAVAPQQIPQSVGRDEASDFDFVHRLPFR